MRRFLCLLALPSLCAADLPESAKPKPVGSPADWVRPEDYPVRALFERRVGVVAFRLDIDERGAVAACQVTISSGTPELDEKACSLLTQRARFEPARDERGNPIPSSYRNRVRWQLPNAEPVAPVDVVVEFDLDVSGGVSNCRMFDALASKVIPEACVRLAQDMRTKVRSSRPVHVMMRTSIEVTDLPPAK